MSLSPYTVEILKYLPSKYVTIFLLIKSMETEIQINQIDKDLIADLYKFNILNLLKNEDRFREIFNKENTSEEKKSSDNSLKKIMKLDKALDENFGNWDSSFSDSE